MPRRSTFHAVLCPWPFLKRASFALLLIALAVPAVESKDVSITAIELYDGANGAAFVQLTGLLINGKAEVRGCGGATQINKSNYGKMPKNLLTPSLTSLEKDAKRTKTLTPRTEAENVLPTNLKI